MFTISQFQSLPFLLHVCFGRDSLASTSTSIASVPSALLSTISQKHWMPQIRRVLLNHSRCLLLFGPLELPQKKILPNTGELQGKKQPTPQLKEQPREEDTHKTLGVEEAREMERFFPSDTPSAQLSPDDGSPTPILPAVNPPLPTRARCPAPYLPSQAPSAKTSPHDRSPTPTLPAVIPHRPRPPRAQSPPKHPHGERALKRVRFQPGAHSHDATTPISALKENRDNGHPENRPKKRVRFNPVEEFKGPARQQQKEQVPPLPGGGGTIAVNSGSPRTPHNGNGAPRAPYPFLNLRSGNFPKTPLDQPQRSQSKETPNNTGYVDQTAPLKKPSPLHTTGPHQDKTLYTSTLHHEKPLQQMQTGEPLRFLPDTAYPFCGHTLLPQHCPYCLKGKDKEGANPHSKQPRHPPVPPPLNQQEQIRPLSRTNTPTTGHSTLSAPRATSLLPDASQRSMTWTTSWVHPPATPVPQTTDMSQQPKQTLAPPRLTSNAPTLCFTIAHPTKAGHTIQVHPGRTFGACPHSLLLTKCRSCESLLGRRRFRTEDYQVRPDLLPLIVKTLGCDPPVIDAFASSENHLCPIFWTETEDALCQDWVKPTPIWANPPFSLLPTILTKVKTQGAHVIIIIPEWNGIYQAFLSLALGSFQLPQGQIFRKRGKDLMPPPIWNVWALYINLPRMAKEQINTPSTLVDHKSGPPNALQLDLNPKRLERSCPHTSDHNVPRPAPPINHPITGRGDLLSSGLHPNPGPGSAPSSSDEPLLDFRLANMATQWQFQFSEDAFQGESSDSPSFYVLTTTLYVFQCTSCGGQRWIRDPYVEIPTLNSTSCPEHRPSLSSQGPLQIYAPWYRTPHSSRDSRTTIPQPHEKTGRGEALLSNGDIEADPGPPFPTINGGLEQQPGSRPARTGRGSTLLSHGDIQSNPGPDTTSPMEQDTAQPNQPSVTSQPFACPFPDCTWTATSTRPPLLRHLNAVHISAGLAPEPSWVNAMDCWICRPCRTIQGCRTSCKGAHVQRISGTFSPHPSILLTEPEPPTAPTVRAILQLRSGTIRHIPMGARAACGKSLGHLLRSLCVLQTWDSLQRLLLFAKWVLQPPPRWGRKHRMGNVRAIINRTTDILERPLHELWSELNAQHTPRRSNRKRQRQDTLEQYDESLESRLQSLIGEGALGKAAKHLISEGVHDPCDPKVLETLRLLHPQPPTDPKIPSCSSWGTCLQDDPGARKQTLKTVIQSFPPGSAPGPSGLRPKHLQDILQGDQQGSTALLHGLALLTESCETGSIPQTAATHLCSASLIALKKPTGNRVRPVAVGETLRRVVEKYLMRLPQTQDSAQGLQPHQFGLGFQNACEILGRSLQQFIDWSDLPEDWGVLQIDLSNAFNAVDRSAVLRGVSSFCPHLLPWAIMSLQRPATLYSPFGELLSAQGVQQGSPLGPLFFTVAIQSIIKRCPPSLDWNVWYMDDGTILGRKQTLINTLTFLVHEFRNIGLETNISKCTLWGPLTKTLSETAEHSILASVKHIAWTPESGTCLLGVPIHYPKTPGFLRTHFSKTLEAVKNLCANLLLKLRDSQVQLAILRGCYSACKFTFLLRSTAATACRDILRQADAILRETFESLLGTPVSDHQWIQCTLSFQTGGLGISSPLYQCAPATVAGMATWTEKSMSIRPNNAPIQGLWGAGEAITWLTEQIGPNCHPLSEWLQIGKMSPIEPDHMKQKWWSEKVSASRRSALLLDAAPRDVVRLRCQASPTASAWSRAPPSRGLGTKIPRDRYRIMLRWHLGLPILPPSSAGKACPLCGRAMDIFGDHAVSCNRNNLWRRHFLLQDFLLRLLRAAGFQATREESLGGTDRREADILIQNWDGIKPLALDLTVRHPRAPGQSHSDPERVLVKAEEDKRKNAEPQAAIANASFEPLVLHTWSGVSTSGTSNATLKKVLQRISENRPGLDRDQTLSDITEGLSCILFSQIAEQLTNVLASTEVPVIPACNLPDYVDEFGNEASGLLCNPPLSRRDSPQHPQHPADNHAAYRQAVASPDRSHPAQPEPHPPPGITSDQSSSSTDLLPIHPDLPWYFPDPVAGLPPLQITTLQDRDLFPIDPLLLQTLHQFLIEEGQPFSSLFPSS